jgi:hypothetical protein
MRDEGSAKHPNATATSSFLNSGIQKTVDPHAGPKLNSTDLPLSPHRT